MGSLCYNIYITIIGEIIMSQSLDDFILANFESMSISQIAKLYNVQRATVKRHANKLGLAKREKYQCKPEVPVKIIPCPELEGKYSIDTNGVVFSNETLYIVSTKKLNNNGYPILTIQINRHKRYYLLHRLLALTFIPKSVNDGDFINHKDGVKTNYQLDNLEWVTPKQNAEHASKTGLLLGNSGENNRNSKLTLDDVKHIRELYANDVKHIRELYANGVKQADIVRALPNATKSNVEKLLKGLTWKNF